MKKSLIIIVILSLSCFSGYSQKFVTKNGFIKFYSDSPLEKIEAVNRTVNAAMDVATGDFVFKVLMKSFVFEKALMQEHFNEKYVESDKYPNATLLAKVVNIKDVNLEKPGVYPVTIEGKLTIHGETKQVSEKGTLEVKDGKIMGKAKFNVLLSDYKISIPGAVANNIAKSIEITVDVVLDKFN
jgi:polyisoprenoid-binding protein YceI